MKVKIKYGKSYKLLDSIVRLEEPNLEKIIIMREEIEFITPNDSPENMNKWLSSERKTEFAQKMQDADKEHTYEITEISISK